LTESACLLLGSGPRHRCGRTVWVFWAPQGGGLRGRAVYPAAGRRHDRARAERSHHLLPLQGRGVLLQHPRRRGAFDECGVDVRGGPSRWWSRSRTTSRSTQTASTRSD